MNAEQLLAHFDRISEAPDAILQLRQFVLELAVRGKLVERDPKDRSALKEANNSTLAFTEDTLFEIPDTWSWVRVGEIADCRLGKMLDRAKNKGTPRRYLRNVNVRWFDFDLSDVLEMPFQDSELDEFSLRQGDVLICEGGEPGRAAVWDERETDIYFQKAIHRVRFASSVDPHFFVNVLRVSAENGRLATYFTGTGIKHLTGKGLAAFPFPLPPLAEQHRIIGKVNELIALLDRLEAVRGERESRRDRLVVATLQRLSQPVGEDTTVAREHARFYLRHLPRLTARPEQVKLLRQAILDLAIRGKLITTPNFPKHPESLREFAALQNGYAFKSEWFVNTGIRLLRNTNVGHDIIDWSDLACLPQTRAPEFSRFQLNEGDVVLSLDRPFIATGTKVARIRPDDLPCLLLQRVGRFQLTVRLSPEYLLLWIRSTHFTDQIDPGRSNGVPHISSKQVEAAEIFVPSLADQHRIVAKVDELMALCDQLEAQFTTTQTESRRLLEAVLHEALSAA